MKDFLKILVIILLSIVIFHQYHMEGKNYVPVQIVNDITPQDNPIVRKLESEGIKSSETLVNAIHFASEQNDVSPDLIIAVTKTESNYNEKAVSNMGYHGLMQIPQKVYYTDANILIGTRILREKINYAKGDMTKALLLYKGYPLDSARGMQQVRKVYNIYHRVRLVT